MESDVYSSDYSDRQAAGIGDETTKPDQPDHPSIAFVESSNRSFEDLAEAALFPAENPNPVFRVSPDGRVLYANRACLPLLAAWGVAEDGRIPRLWQERLGGVLSSGEAQKWEAPCDDRVLELNCVPIAGSGYVNVYGSDVTDRIALLARLTEEQQRLAEQARLAERRAAELEATLDAITDGVALYDPQGHLVRMNASGARILGYHPAETGLPPAERATLIQAAIVDDPDAPIERFPLMRALRGETVRRQLMSFRPAGEIEGATRYVLASAVPVADAKGERVGVVASFTDVTELRRARDELERRVQEATAELEAIFASVPDALYVTDTYGIVRANQATLRSFGVASVEDLWMSAAALAELVQARRVDTGQPLWPGDTVLDHALRGEPVVREVLSRKIDTGREVIHRSAGGPIVVNGQIVGAVAILTDITEQKRAQERIARQAEMLEKANEELSASREQLRALSRRLVDMQEAERTYVADQLYNQAGQVLAALQLQVARLDVDGRAPTGQIPAIKATLNEAIRELHELASQLRPVTLDRASLARVLKSQVTEFGKRNDLEVHYDPGDAELLRMPRDVRTAIFRAVQEGLANVAHHAQATEITLSLRRDGDMLAVTLGDNGVGFHPDREVLAGSLGLAGMRERLKAIGGHLTITSGSAGTTLQMQVPISVEE